MHEHYGVDLSSGIMDQRSWRWFKVRMFGLLSTEGRLSRHFFPPEEPTMPKMRGV